jgi:chromate transporter
VSRRVGAALLVLCGALLLLLPALAACGGSVTLSAISAFYRAGALVFGGGHVLLPLLQAGVVPTGWVANDAFLAGYGAAQTVPGPLFTFAAYLGAVMPAPLGGWVGGLVLLLAIFVPAFLLVVGALPFWEALRLRDGVQRAMGGINAASAFGLLVYGKVSPVAVVAFAALCGWAMAG